MEDDPGEDGAFITTLREGTRVRVRPLVRGDRQRLAEGFSKLSVNSRYLRFFSPLTHLSGRMLDGLTDVDGKHHVAVAAIALDPPGQPGIGLARYVRSRTDSTSAEAAVVVLDEFQRRGLGRLLLETLAAHAHLHGIERFSAPVLRGNTAILAGVARYLPVLEAGDAGSLQMTVSLREVLRVMGAAAAEAAKR